VKVSLWGTRGSLASPGPDTLRFGGNTSCVSVEGSQETLLVLDGGTGIRKLGQQLPQTIKSVYILLTHLHMDHVQGLPFFAPLRRQGVEVHIWGPASTTMSLRSRLLRYLSPPLFPVSVREILSDLHFHELPYGTIEIREFKVTAQMIVHPNPTVGYKIEDQDFSLTYLPDHEPALGVKSFPIGEDWTSGYDLAEGADLLIHDSQYTIEEYEDRVGFGHSCLNHAFRFGELTQVKQFVPFHHDPAHTDDMLDKLIANTIDDFQPSFNVLPGKEGAVLELGKMSQVDSPKSANETPTGF
jgi:phosphoribosyl 1,2-cyclic phosphodiesterase